MIELKDIKDEIIKNIKTRNYVDLKEDNSKIYPENAFSLTLRFYDDLDVCVEEGDILLLGPYKYKVNKIYKLNYENTRTELHLEQISVNKSCRFCYYYVGYIAEFGICRRYPEQIEKTRNMWCGEFKVNENKLEKEELIKEIKENCENDDNNEG